MSEPNMIEIIPKNDNTILGSGENHLSVFETVFANVTSNVVFGIIVAIVLYLIFSYLYETYIEVPLNNVKSDMQYIKNKVNAMFTLIEKLAKTFGGGISDIGGVINNPSSLPQVVTKTGGSVLGGVGKMFGF